MADTPLSDVTRRTIAAFHTAAFLDDLVASLREQRLTNRVSRWREADGNPSEIDS
jgi:hypothetical protein